VEEQIIGRKCSKCNEFKLFNEFHKNKKGKHGVNHLCKSCVKVKTKKYWAENKEVMKLRKQAWIDKDPEKAKASKRTSDAKSYEKNKDKYKCRMLRKKYGITYNEYKIMLKNQENCCAICKGQETTRDHKKGKLRELSVDHCHTTLKIRGLLCSHCNRSLGLLKDSVVVLKAAVKYLEEN